MLKPAQLELADKLGLVKTVVDTDRAAKDPRISGGLVAAMCPCGREIGLEDSYSLGVDGHRYHYPECSQRS
jgi:hypothetical protein